MLSMYSIYEVSTIIKFSFKFITDKIDFSCIVLNNNLYKIRKFSIMVIDEHV